MWPIPLLGAPRTRQTMAYNHHILGETMQQQQQSYSSRILNKRPSMVPKVSHFLVTALCLFAFINLRGEDRKGFELAWTTIEKIRMCNWPDWLSEWGCLVLEDNVKSSDLIAYPSPGYLKEHFCLAASKTKRDVAWWCSSQWLPL